jgi:hypothetical protein
MAGPPWAVTASSSSPTRRRPTGSTPRHPSPS